MLKCSPTCASIMNRFTMTGRQAKPDQLESTERPRQSESQIANGDNMEKIWSAPIPANWVRLGVILQQERKKVCISFRGMSNFMLLSRTPWLRFCGIDSFVLEVTFCVPNHGTKKNRLEGDI